LSQEIPLL